MSLRPKNNGASYHARQRQQSKDYSARRRHLEWVRENGSAEEIAQMERECAEDSARMAHHRAGYETLGNGGYRKSRHGLSENR
jgi:hypothetical protein